tara:strand:- start:3533 stop:4909 length:1377 start_codon:yes stop_codon:yes gene_type:complete
MHIRKFDRLFSRRKFLSDAAKGVLSTGVLGSTWDAIAASGEINKAYPDELLSVEAYTKGKIKTGDMITSANVEHVRDLLEPIRFEQILKHGRQLRVVKTTSDLMKTSPWEYIEATLANAGKAKFDEKGNVVAPDGRPWIGGNPFPDPKSALELMAAQTLNWGRHDAVTYATEIQVIDSKGKKRHHYAGALVELAPVGRVVMEPKPYWPEHMDKMRFFNVVFTEPNQFAGTSFLSIWDYDHSTFPKLYGYVPEFRRVRQFPTNQRFEPLVPGLSLYLSDAWGAGDPLYTWGNYKIINRGPFLGGLSGGWNADDPDWKHETHGGPNGDSFWNADVEMIPEVITIEAQPTGFPRAPVSKKRVWFDARNGLLAGMISYDRQGLPFRSFDGAYAHYESGDKKFMDGKHPYWSWGHVTASNIQTGEVSRLEQVRQVDNHVSGANHPKTYDDYMTQAAVVRMGKV